MYNKPTATLVSRSNSNRTAENVINVGDTSRPMPSTWKEATFSEQKEVAVAVMGATGSGKTTFINLLSGSSLRVGRGLQSCTSVVQAAVPFEFEGRRVLLIDTPGFDDTTKSDADILKMIAQFLSITYHNRMCLSGVIYMHRISDFRMGGISRRNFSIFRELCGERFLQNVVLVTNMWSEVSLEVGEAREAELRERDMFFKPVLDKHARLLRHGNTLESARAILRQIIDNRPMSLRIQRELVDQHLEILQTAAGAELNRELIEQARKHQDELLNVQIEMKAAIDARDEETRKELEKETDILQAKAARIQMDSQKLASDFNQEIVRIERQMQTIVETARRDAERVAVERWQQMEELRRQMQHAGNVSEAHKETIQRQIGNLQLRSEASRNHAGSGVGLFGQIGRIIDTVLMFI